MADLDSYSKPQNQKPDQKSQENPTKFYNHFLYKAAIVTLFLIILPLFPSQAPDFINQTLLTRSWELLHLLFVGIAISYGLFSRRNEETEKETKHGSNFDNAQSYVSQFLQVSSVFDDEVENTSGSDESKMQTWSNRYYRKEPMVVVAQENSVLDEQRGEKPLLLPVRSLKSVNENSFDSGSVSGSNSRSGSKRFSGRGKNGEFGGLNHEELEEKLKGNVVLPSPIPWRSRSGRMEMKEEIADSFSSHTGASSMEEPEVNQFESRASRPQSSRLSRPNSSNSSPKLSPSSSSKKLSPSSSSSQSQAKVAEDNVKKKKSFVMSNPPPAPPLPPPFVPKSSSLKPNSSFNNGGNGISFEKDLRRSFTNESVESRRSNFDGIPTGKSVRTTVGDKRVDKKVEKTLQPNKKVTFDQEEEYLVDAAFMESEEETESEDDGSFVENEITETPKQIVKNDKETRTNSVGDGGPDVDKKADEFIAKFREQIRLQRIESIKRSSAQISRKLAR
ncbi:hypothetical protein UlMin_001593 [Ulmus minor]